MATDQSHGGDGDGGTAGPGTALRVNRSLTVPMSEITWRATTSGGPGGQHANRTLSRVEVQFDIGASAALGPRLGQLALERLASRLAEGLRVDPDRRPTRPTKGSQVRRVEEKRHRAEIKRRRRPPGEHDE